MDNTFKFISIDPGTTHIGFSIWVVDAVTLEIVNVNAFTLHYTSIIDKELEEKFGSRFIKLLAIEKAFKELLETHKPNSVACESPFYFFKRPGAFAPLVETLYILKRAVFNYDVSVPFITYDPSSIKNSIGAKGNSDKEIMKNTMSNFKEIPISLEFINSLDEHSIDSIAVGYCHYLRYIMDKVKPTKSVK